MVAIMATRKRRAAKHPRVSAAPQAVNPEQTEQLTADQLIGEAESMLDSSPTDSDSPSTTMRKRRGPGRRSNAEIEAERTAQQAESEAAVVVLLEPAFLAMGQSVFHTMLKIPDPPWQSEQATALAKAWAPLLNAYVQSPVVAAVLTTIGVTLPYWVVLAQRRQAVVAQQREIARLDVPHADPA